MPYTTHSKLCRISKALGNWLWTTLLASSPDALPNQPKPHHSGLLPAPQNPCYTSGLGPWLASCCHLCPGMPLPLCLPGTFILQSSAHVTISLHFLWHSSFSTRYNYSFIYIFFSLYIYINIVISLPVLFLLSFPKPRFLMNLFFFFFWPCCQLPGS